MGGPTPLYGVSFIHLLGLSLDAQSLKVKDKRDTRRRTIRMLLFTSATNMKPMHRLTPVRKSLVRVFDPPTSSLVYPCSPSPQD